MKQKARITVLYLLCVILWGSVAALQRNDDTIAVELKSCGSADSASPVVNHKPPDTGTPETATGGAGSCVPINSASAETFATLPGIGPVIAQRIIEYRTLHGAFLKVADITMVKGIGPAKLRKIEGMLCL